MWERIPFNVVFVPINSRCWPRLWGSTPGSAGETGAVIPGLSQTSEQVVRTQGHNSKHVLRRMFFAFCTVGGTPVGEEKATNPSEPFLRIICCWIGVVGALPVPFKQLQVMEPSMQWGFYARPHFVFIEFWRMAVMLGRCLNARQVSGASDLTPNIFQSWAFRWRRAGFTANPS